MDAALASGKETISSVKKIQDQVEELHSAQIKKQLEKGRTMLEKEKERILKNENNQENSYGQPGLKDTYSDGRNATGDSGRYGNINQGQRGYIMSGGQGGTPDGMPMRDSWSSGYGMKGPQGNNPWNSQHGTRSFDGRGDMTPEMIKKMDAIGGVYPSGIGSGGPSGSTWPTDSPSTEPTLTTAPTSWQPQPNTPYNPSMVQTGPSIGAPTNVFIPPIQPSTGGATPSMMPMPTDPPPLTATFSEIAYWFLDAFGIRR